MASELVPDLKDKRDRSWTRMLLGVFFLLVFTLVLLELFSFLATKAKLLSFNENPPYTMTPHAGLNWRTEDDSWGAWHADHATDRHVTDCFDIEYQSNNIGARDTRDYDYSLEDHSIVLIGDSFAEGVGVNIEDTFAKKVEQQTGRTVMNFGAGGNVGPVQEELIYNELASEFPHNELIYMFLPRNDFADNAPQSMGMLGNRYRPYYQRTDDGYTVVYPENAVQGTPYPGSNQNQNLIGHVKMFLVGYTYTYNTLKTLKYLVYTDSPTGGDRVSSGYFTDDDELVRAALFFVDRLLSSAQHKAITVILIPTVTDLKRISRGLGYKNKPWYTGLKQVADIHNARFIGLAMHISHDDYNRLYLSCDGHWSPEGHTFAAELYLANP